MTPRRYVVLAHYHNGLHYDLMLEVDGVLKTWKLHEPPRPGQSLAAVRSFDHRLIYLDYEGEISSDRGRVEAWDRGGYVGDVEKDLIVVDLHGTRLRGKLTLSLEKGDTWLAIYAE